MDKKQFYKSLLYCWEKIEVCKYMLDNLMLNSYEIKIAKEKLRFNRWYLENILDVECNIDLRR